MSCLFFSKKGKYINKRNSPTKTENCHSLTLVSLLYCCLLYLLYNVMQIIPSCHTNVTQYCFKHSVFSQPKPASSLLSVYIIPWVQKHVQQHHDFFHVSVQNVCYFENCHGLLFVFFFSPHCRQTFSRRLLAKYERCLSSYSECWWTRSQTVVNVA